MRRNNHLFVTITAVVITAVLSFSISAFIFTGWNYAGSDGISFDTKVVDAEKIKKFNKVRSLLMSEYYEKVDENQLVEGAIAGMADSLGDRYTAYYPKEQWQMLQEAVEGSYVGIGVTVNTDTDGILTVVEPFRGSPADEAGIKSGDKIIGVDDVDVQRMKEDLIIEKIRGKENTKVKISVYRPSEEKFLDFNVTRRVVKIDNIESKVLEGDIGYIRLIKFDADIAKQFEDALNKLMKKNIKGLVIDVRDNPGGYYSQVVEIADRLLPKGIIVYTEDKYKKKEIQYSDADHLELPLVLLVNGHSASASEILAGAIKDHKRGVLVGTKTFGKGLVQAPIPLGDGSGLKVTIQRYFTPSGVCIHGIGINPDIVVEPAEAFRDMPVSQIPENKDVQLGRALEELKKAMQK